MAFRKPATERAYHQIRICFSTKEQFENFVYFEEVLAINGGRLEDFLMAQIDFYLETHEKQIQRHAELQEKLVSTDRLQDFIETKYGFRPSRQLLRYYRKARWTIGQQYFYKLAHRRKQYLYNLPKCLIFFDSIARRRGIIEKRYGKNGRPASTRGKVKPEILSLDPIPSVAEKQLNPNSDFQWTSHISALED